MKIAELVPEILQKKCSLVNDERIFIIMDYVKNYNEKNNIKIFDPINQTFSWVPFNIVNLLEENKGE